MEKIMRGVFPILQTPFDKSGGIEQEDLRREVEFAIECGSAGVGFAFGSEMLKLTESERELVVKILVDQSAGRAAVVVNTGAEGTDAAVIHSLTAQDLGADALMVMAPTIFPMGPSDILEYFRRIGQAVHIPIFLQDLPLCPLSPKLIRQINEENPNACYAKIETPPTPQQVSHTVAECGEKLIVFGGAGGVYFIDELQRGAQGTMPHCACPDLFAAVWRLHSEGDVRSAEEQFNRLSPLLRILTQGGGPLAHFISKEVLRLRGVIKTNYVRHPETRPDDVTLGELAEMVEELGLKDARQ